MGVKTTLPVSAIIARSVAYGDKFTDRLLATVNEGSPFSLQIDLPKCQRSDGVVTNVPCLH